MHQEKIFKSEKNRSIAETYAATMERRSCQTVVQVDLKVKYGKEYNMPRVQIDFFDTVFIEAKRFKNHLLNLSSGPYESEEDFIETITEEHAKYLSEHNITYPYEKPEPEDVASSEDDVLDLFHTDQKLFKTVWYYTKGVNNPDTEYVEYELQYLGSYAKTDIINKMCSNIKSLSTNKKNGKKVGHLRYVSEYNSLTYKKQGYGFDINIGNATCRLQGCKKWFKVFGIEQFREIRNADPNYEIATATLVRESDKNFHLHMTVYVDKQKLVNYRKSKIEKKKYVIPGEETVGIDFGCESNFTLSNGKKFSMLVEESEHLKRLQRRLQRCKYGSNNWYRTKLEIQKSYDDLNNKKDELAREFVHYLKLHHEEVVMQDENLAGWMKGNHGKTVWHSVMGRVKELLLNERFIKVVVLDRFIPTTKFCPHCGQMHKSLKLWDRTYVCPKCGRSMDRDVHAAQNMVWIYKECLKHHIIPTDGREITRADFDRLVSMVFGSNAADRVEGMPDDCNRLEPKCCCHQSVEMPAVENHEAQPARVRSTSFQ